MLIPANSGLFRRLGYRDIGCQPSYLVIKEDVLAEGHLLVSLQEMGRMSRANPSQDLLDRAVTPTCEVCQLPPNNFKPQLSLGAGRRPAQLSSCNPRHFVYYLAKLYCQLGVQEDVRTAW